MKISVSTDTYKLDIEAEVPVFSWYDSGVVRFLFALDKCVIHIKSLSYNRIGKSAQYRILSTDTPPKQWNESLEYSVENPTNHKGAQHSRDLPKVSPEIQECFAELSEGCYEMVNQLKITKLDIVRK